MTVTDRQLFALSAQTRGALVAAGLDPDDVVEVIRRALDEDLGTAGDITTTATVPRDATIDASYVARAPGVAAGLPVLAAVVEAYLGRDAALRLERRDGERLGPGDVLASITGPAHGVLAIERLSLNLLGHLSGIATTTRTWVDAVAGTNAAVRDTRKTTPGLRDLEKYAVRCGGGVNHRRGLDDAVLIKDNHIAAAGGVAAALDRVKATVAAGDVVVQIEVDDERQLDEALANGARQILLDNFSVERLTDAVSRVRAHAPEVVIEASGGLSLDSALAVARAGVDYLAVGALTHSAPSLDIGLDHRAS
jgi:nicotinate-nucleotide pyrophosphorylase (carboxylating)